MKPDISIVDNFLSNPDEIRARALRAKYQDMVLKDGQLYKRISADTPGQVVDALNVWMGRPVNVLNMGYRLNYEGEPPNAAIHADLGWGTYALVLYLTRDDELQRLAEPSGTAFWKHINTGADRARPGDSNTIAAVQGDWNNADAWEQVDFVPAKFNRAAIYRSELFHSRYPFEAVGTTPEDGRLTLVSFFM